MAKVTIQPDCGNAPRKVFLKNLYLSLANGDSALLMNHVQDNIHWQVPGKPTILGKENYLKAVVQHKLWKVKEMTIDTIITHGPDASVSGHIKGADNLKYAFCDIYRFKGAGGTTIHAITTLLVQLG